MPYLGETSVQLEKELRNYRKYLKEFAQLSLIHRRHTIGDHFKYKDKQAHLERVFIKETLLIQEQQPDINADNFSTPLYLFNT